MRYGVAGYLDVQFPVHVCNKKGTRQVKPFQRRPSCAATAVKVCRLHNLSVGA